MTMLSDVSDMTVSRETEGKLQAFMELLKKWTPKINLVAPNSVVDAWSRHFLDSAQTFKHRNTDKGLWVDFGSGGGFPGLVCAVLAENQCADLQFRMIESDARKGVFLRTVIRELELKNANVLVQRVESVDPLGADVVSARALASVNDLLLMTKLHLKPSGQALFLKGEKWEKEVADAKKSWKFSVTPHKSETNPMAAILEIGDIFRV